MASHGNTVEVETKNEKENKTTSEFSSSKPYLLLQQPCAWLILFSRIHLPFTPFVFFQFLTTVIVCGSLI